MVQANGEIKKKHKLTGEKDQILKYAFHILGCNLENAKIIPIYSRITVCWASG